MLLELRADVFATQDARQIRQIFHLIGYLVDGRHRWFPDPDLSEVATRYCQEHFPTMGIWREYLRNASKASAWQGSQPRPTVPVTAESLEPVTADLGRPAVVVVENSRNDGSFLKAVFAAYDPSLAEAERLEWLHIDHAGGTGEQVHLAEEQAKKFAEICRVIVIKDNDKGLTVTASADDADSWPPRSPHVHMWHRLEVENYLPDAVLMASSHPDALSLISHLRQMTAEQQRLIDMKNGLKKTPKEVFRDLHPHSRKVWQNGFSGRFPKPLVPETITLTVEDFRNLGEDVHAELTALLAWIRRVT